MKATVWSWQCLQLQHIDFLTFKSPRVANGCQPASISTANKNPTTLKVVWILVRGCRPNYKFSTTRNVVEALADNFHTLSRPVAGYPLVQFTLESLIFIQVFLNIIYLELQKVNFKVPRVHRYTNRMLGWLFLQILSIFIYFITFYSETHNYHFIIFKQNYF